MRILMIYCNTAQENTVPLGITQLIACLQQAGHAVELFHTTFYHQGSKSSAENRMDGLQYRPVQFVYEVTDMFEDLQKKINDFRPDIVGFSIFEATFQQFRSLLDSVRDLIKLRNIKVAVGGVHALFWPESIAEVEDVDFISIAEAEKTFVQLCDKLSRKESCKDQAGFWIKEDGIWHKNKATELIDLDTLPVGDQTVFGDRYMMKPMMGKLRKTVTVELSRGCPYSCTFCADPFLNREFKPLGKWYRLKSVPKLGEEFALVIEKYKPEFIYKFSETFLAAGKKWLQDYYDMYKKYRIPFWTESRPETITEDNIKMLADLNCMRFSIGLESGNEDFRKKHLSRGYSNQQVFNAAEILRRNGISFSMNMIIGFPFETREMIFDGIDVLREVKADGVSVCIFTPYKGSALRVVCEEHDMIDKDLICEDYFQMKYLLRNNTFTEPEIIGLWRTIPLYISLPKSRYPLIRKAECLTIAGDRIFNDLKKEFYDVMGWNK